MTPGRCSECGEAVLVSASGMALIGEGAEPICERCCARQVAASGETPTFALTAEAVEEIERRRATLAQRYGVPNEDVETWPPAALRVALDAVERQN